MYVINTVLSRPKLFKTNSLKSFLRITTFLYRKRPLVYNSPPERNLFLQYPFLLFFRLEAVRIETRGGRKEFARTLMAKGRCMEKEITR